MTEKKTKTLISWLIESFKKNSDRTALEVNDLTLTYTQLLERALKYTALINKIKNEEDIFIGLFAYRTHTAYEGILGILFSGLGYMPLNKTLPIERTKKALINSGISKIIVDTTSIKYLSSLLSGIEKKFTIIVSDEQILRSYKDILKPHTIITLENGNNNQDFMDITSDTYAYLLFTSGTTGEPKGIAIRHKNIVNYIENLNNFSSPTCEDRFSQMHDLTFDNSVFDMFFCWLNGGSLCVPSDQYLLMPWAFLKDKLLSIWFSVPSVAVLMKRQKMLKKDMFPTLKWSFFAGESFSDSLAKDWKDASPNTRIINLYGPTEATVDCSYYEWVKDISTKESLNDILPIGKPFKNMDLIVIDENLQIVPPGNKGELCLSGLQVTEGYWNNIELTEEKFIKVIKNDEIIKYYRTGDLVVYNESYGFNFLGRIDDQIKILGYRIELQEIEAVIKDIVKTETVSAVGWPVTERQVDGIYVFISGVNMESAYIINLCRKLLPNYMIPKKIIFLDALPLNVNGKTDKKKLIQMLTNDI
ncbi:MAG: amino acid adenylation domain-containing protein [Nitrospirae bacterium]|nr:amino acid adenylation domain-containing protein [Nitrospirota bacterium]